MISDVQICHEMVDALGRLKETIGTTTHTSIIASWPGGSNNVMELVTPLPMVAGSYAAWTNTVVDVSAAVNPKTTPMYALVQTVEGNGSRVRLASTFPKTRKPAAGDTIVFSSGPLGEAMIYFEEPASVEHEIAAGKKFFVTVDSMEGSYEINTGGTRARASQGEVQPESIISFDILCESYLLTGSEFDAGTTEYIQTEEAIYRSIYDSPKLKDQVSMEVLRFLGGGCNQNFETPSIDWEKGLAERANRRLMKVSRLSTSATLK